jgi:Ca2+-binding RTX toxin-like protein
MSKTAKTTTKITATTDQDASLFDSILPATDSLLYPGFFLQGTTGNDLISGSIGDDLILGRAGNDRLYGEDGNDILDGGTGNDLLVGGRGADTLIGGEGYDTASYANAASAVIADLRSSGWSGDAAGDTYQGIERVIGSRFNDRIYGDDLNNDLEGGLGNDVLTGGGGDDWLRGGFGADTLIGDTGRDYFWIDREAGVVDRILDFQTGVDSIVLTGFEGLSTGNDLHLGYGNLMSGATNASSRYLDASDTLYYDVDTQTLYKVVVQMAGSRPVIVSHEAIVEIVTPSHSFLPKGDDLLFG